jgi:hypothetical protein
MKRFVKIFKGYTNEVENEINEIARKRNLIIVSISTSINQGILFATVVFEKGGE